MTLDGHLEQHKGLRAQAAASEIAIISAVERLLPKSFVWQTLFDAFQTNLFLLHISEQTTSSANRSNSNNNN